jgi:hypothetical protein
MRLYPPLPASKRLQPTRLWKGEPANFAGLGGCSGFVVVGEKILGEQLRTIRRFSGEQWRTAGE